MSAAAVEPIRAVRRLRRRDLPELLQQIHDPPRSLFLRGAPDPEILARPAVAIVGARACSPYGAQVARMLGRELAAAGLVVVSGLARGIDGEAHRGALDAGGVTVAVLGCGIDRDYPAAHSELARRICERGLVVSEYEPGVEPAPWRFPARNRIIAGLTAVTVIVEARERSGALITADFALEDGREVLAVPGEITGTLSTGTNRLLRQGATPSRRPTMCSSCSGSRLPSGRALLLWARARRRYSSGSPTARPARTSCRVRPGSTRGPSQRLSQSSSLRGSLPRLTVGTGRWCRH